MNLKTLILYLTAACLLCLHGLYSQEAGSVGGNSSTTSNGGSTSAGASSVGVVVGENYVLKSSDVISVQIFKENDLGKSVRIEGDGTVALALIGKVKVAGMTVSEAQSLITDLYNRDYLVDPQISVIVVSFAPKFVHVLGNVGSPGKVKIAPDQDLTLIDAMSQARGVTRLGNPRKVRIKRSDGSKPFDVNYDEIRRGDAKDIILMEGDTITVPERVF